MSDQKQVKMGVCVAVASSGRPVPIEWAMSIATLAYPVGQNHCWQISKADPDSRQLTRDAQRETLTDRAIALGADYLIFFDDDTVPPPHAIRSLWYVLEQNSKAAIAGGIYCSKENAEPDPKPAPLVFMELGGGSFWNWTLGDIFKCKGIGTGCMMIRLAALKDIPKPWFKDTLTNERQGRQKVGDLELEVVDASGTDDLFFCRRVTEAGWDILAHGGVLCIHIGQDGKQYVLPDDSYPVVSYLKKRAEFDAGIGADPKNPDKIVSELVEK